MKSGRPPLPHTNYVMMDDALSDDCLTEIFCQCRLVDLPSASAVNVRFRRLLTSKSEPRSEIPPSVVWLCSGSQLAHRARARAASLFLAGWAPEWDAKTSETISVDDPEMCNDYMMRSQALGSTARTLRTEHSIDSVGPGVPALLVRRLEALFDEFEQRSAKYTATLHNIVRLLDACPEQSRSTICRAHGLDDDDDDLALLLLVHDVALLPAIRAAVARRAARPVLPAATNVRPSPHAERSQLISVASQVARALTHFAPLLLLHSRPLARYSRHQQEASSSGRTAAGSQLDALASSAPDAMEYLAAHRSELGALVVRMASLPRFNLLLRDLVKLLGMDSGLAASGAMADAQEASLAVNDVWLRINEELRRRAPTARRHASDHGLSPSTSRPAGDSLTWTQWLRITTRAWIVGGSSD